MTIQAVHKKNQSQVNRFIQWDKKYNDLVDRQLDETARGEAAYDKAYTLFNDLPKTEQLNLQKQLKDPYLIKSYT